MAPPATMDGSRGANQGHDLMDAHIDVENPFVDVDDMVSEQQRQDIASSQPNSSSSAAPFRPSTPTHSSLPPRSSSPVSPIVENSSTLLPQHLDFDQPQSSRQTPIIPQNTTSANRSSIAKSPGLGLGLTFDQTPNLSSRTGVMDSSSTPRLSSDDARGHRSSQPSFSQLHRVSSVASSNLQPAHPYGLYQQATFEELDESDNESSAPAGVGFLNRSTNFNRSRGADGEELGVIGPDGHAEQLPPYTRYPAVGHTAGKEPPASAGLLIDHPVTSSPAALEPALGTDENPTSNVVSPIANAETDRSFVDLGQPQPLPSPVLPSPVLPSRPSEAHVGSFISSEASSMLEKPGFEEPRKRKRDRRVLCGTVPMWVVIVFAFFCMVLAIIAGGVVGGLVSRHDKSQSHRVGSGTVTVTSGTSMYDASPIAAPTGIAPLPTGTFFFPLGAPSNQERSCIEPSRDTTAWGCAITYQLMMIDFRTFGGMPNAKIYPAPPPTGLEGTVQYGAQPPRGTYPMQRLQWVQDTKDSNRGPALYFQTVYNKLVIIEAEKFPGPGQSLQKRGWGSAGRKDYDGPAPSMSYNPSAPKRYANKPGEEPWHCFWNGTMLEGYIYVKEDVPGAQTQRFTASEPTADASGAASTSGATSASSTTATSNAATTAPQISARAVLSPRSADASADSMSAPITTAPARFPLIVKINERRYANPAFKPYCQKMMVNADGSIVPKLDSSGNKIIETIKEPTWSNKANSNRFVNLGPNYSDYLRSTYGAKFRRGLSERDAAAANDLTKRDNTSPTNGCMCQWITPFG